MPAITQAQIFAKQTQGDVLAADAVPARERDLMRPTAVDCEFAEFAFAVDHARSMVNKTRTVNT